MMTQISEEGQLVRLSAACKYLFGNADESTKMRMYRMIDRDEIVARKFGTRWFIPREEIERIAGSGRPDGD